jgi:DNA replication protein
MKPFQGFPEGKFTRLPVPPNFFSEWLPQIDDVQELKLTLFCFQALGQMENATPYLRMRHFTNDSALMYSLQDEARLKEVLDMAIARGTLLSADVILENKHERLFLINTPKGRKTLEQIQKGNWRAKSADLGIEILPERPNIYTLYEQNIGMLTAHIAEEIKLAEQDYPADWLEDAVKIAVESNKRNWRYIRAILQRWKQEGRHNETSQRHRLEGGEQYTGGKYADIIES